jgi:hypothetical protein
LLDEELKKRPNLIKKEDDGKNWTNSIK